MFGKCTECVRLDNSDAALVGTLNTEPLDVFRASVEAGSIELKFVVEAIAIAANSQLLPFPLSLGVLRGIAHGVGVWSKAAFMFFRLRGPYPIKPPTSGHKPARPYSAYSPGSFRVLGGGKKMPGALGAFFGVFEGRFPMDSAHRQVYLKVGVACDC